MQSKEFDYQVDKLVNKYKYLCCYIDKNNKPVSVINECNQLVNKHEDLIEMNKPVKPLQTFRLKKYHK